MRTLKKTLSLVLALVLCFGLVGSAFALNVEKYTDGESVGAAYAEAAEVMIGLGIIKGMTDTEIGATGTLTREQAAKIVCYLALGGTVADMLKADAAPFKDVAADRWSAGYIDYCADKGILAGYGDGNFGPADELTGFQFAKMLLAALGYGKANEFTPESWSINTATIGFQNGIFDGDAKTAVHAPITRQQAMLMAFNALFAQTKAYDKNKGIYEKYNTNFAADVHKLAAASVAGDDAFLRPTKVWNQTVNGTPKEIAVVAEKPLATYVNNFTAAGAAAAGYTFAGITSANIAYNGAYGELELTDLYTVAGAINGYTVELYGNPVTKAVSEIVVSEGYFAVIGKVVPAAGATPASITISVYEAGKMSNDATNAAATLKFVDNTKNPADAFDKLSAYAEKAGVVVYLKPQWDTVLSTADASAYFLKAEATTTVTGAITAVALNPAFTKNCTTKVTVAGTAYACNNQFVGASALTADKTKTGTLYIDANGNAIAWAGDKVVTVPQYAYVLDVDKVDAGLFEAADTYYAKLLYADGTVETVKIPEADKDLKDDVVKYADGTGADTGKIDLTKVVDVAVADYTFTKNSVELKSKVINNNTVFVVETTDATTKQPVYTVYTGMTNLPALKAKSFAGVATELDANVWAVCFIKGAQLTVAPTVTTDVVYVANKVNTISDATLGTYYVYNAIVNGTVTTINSSNASLAAGYYGKLTLDAKGLVESGDALSAATIALVNETKTAVAAAGVIKLGSTNYIYDANTTVYTIGATGITAGTIAGIKADANDTVKAYTTNGILTMVVITTVA